MTDNDLREAHDVLELYACISDAQERFAALLRSYLSHHPTTVDQYIRYPQVRCQNPL